MSDGCFAPPIRSFVELLPTPASGRLIGDKVDLHRGKATESISRLHTTGTTSRYYRCMPRSKNNRRKKPPQRKESKLALSNFAIKEERHDEFKKTILAAARHSVDEFPATLQIVTDELRKSDPIGIVPTFAAYGLQTLAGREGVNTKSVLKDIQQHHAELLLALVMTIPLDEWGKDPFTPAIMGTVFETVPKVAETFLHQRILAAEGVTDKQEFTVLSLQERIRLHTQAVRNWGTTPMSSVSAPIYTDP